MFTEKKYVFKPDASSVKTAPETIQPPIPGQTPPEPVVIYDGFWNRGFERLTIEIAEEQLKRTS